MSTARSHIAGKLVRKALVSGRSVPGDRTATLGHYSTPMMTFSLNTLRVLVVNSLGHGSVSDQSGMNAAFYALVAPFHYDRQGGAHIRALQGAYDIGMPPGETLA